MHAACGESGITTLNCGAGVEKDTEVDERVICSSTKPASGSGCTTTTPSITLSTADSGGSTSGDVVHGGRRGKAINDNFVRLK